MTISGSSLARIDDRIAGGVTVTKNGIECLEEDRHIIMACLFDPAFDEEDETEFTPSAANEEALIAECKDIFKDLPDGTTIQFYGYCGCTSYGVCITTREGDYTVVYYVAGDVTVSAFLGDIEIPTSCVPEHLILTIDAVYDIHNRFEEDVEYNKQDEITRRVTNALADHMLKSINFVHLRLLEVTVIRDATEYVYKISDDGVRTTMCCDGAEVKYRPLPQEMQIFTQLYNLWTESLPKTFTYSGIRKERQEKLSEFFALFRLCTNRYDNILAMTNIIDGVFDSDFDTIMHWIDSNNQIVAPHSTFMVNDMPYNNIPKLLYVVKLIANDKYQQFLNHYHVTNDEVEHQLKGLFLCDSIYSYVHDCQEVHIECVVNSLLKVSWTGHQYSSEKAPQCYVKIYDSGKYTKFTFKVNGHRVSCTELNRQSLEAQSIMRLWISQFRYDGIRQKRLDRLKKFDWWNSTNFETHKCVCYFVDNVWDDWSVKKSVTLMEAIFSRYPHVRTYVICMLRELYENFQEYLNLITPLNDFEGRCLRGEVTEEEIVQKYFTNPNIEDVCGKCGFSEDGVKTKIIHAQLTHVHTLVVGGDFDAALKYLLTWFPRCVKHSFGEIDTIARGLLMSFPDDLKFKAFTDFDMFSDYVDSLNLSKREKIAAAIEFNKIRRPA